MNEGNHALHSGPFVRIRRRRITRFRLGCYRIPINSYKVTPSSCPRLVCKKKDHLFDWPLMCLFKEERRCSTGTQPNFGVGGRQSPAAPRAFTNGGFCGRHSMAKSPLSIPLNLSIALLRILHDPITAQYPTFARFSLYHSTTVHL